nr:hypothetical protein [Nocardia nova]
MLAVDGSGPFRECRYESFTVAGEYLARVGRVVEGKVGAYFEQGCAHPVGKDHVAFEILARTLDSVPASVAAGDSDVGEVDVAFLGLELVDGVDRRVHGDRIFAVTAPPRTDLPLGLIDAADAVLLALQIEAD